MFGTKSRKYCMYSEGPVGIEHLEYAASGAAWEHLEISEIILDDKRKVLI